jgi:hypothetical protein
MEKFVIIILIIIILLLLLCDNNENFKISNIVDKTKINKHIKKYFITFGGPSKRFHEAVNRIKREAEELGIYDKIIGYTDKELKDKNKFWKKHGKFIESNPRGYGYWLWKSFITKETLKEMNENDILVYADSGCSLNKNGTKRLLEYFDIVKNSSLGILSFELDYIEKSYTKMDIFKEMNVFELMDTKQLVGGIFIIRKCERTVNLVKELYKLCSNYHLINDDPSKIPNSPDFIDYRHDQSIFSLLRKKRGTEILRDETYFYPDWDILGKNYPIWAIRNNSR